MDDGWLIIIAIARRHILVMNLYVAYWWRGKLQCLEGSFTRHATRLQSEWKMEWKREKKWVARFVVLFSFENVCMYVPDLHVRLPARNSLRLASIYFQFAHSSFDVRLLA